MPSIRSNGITYDLPPLGRYLCDAISIAVGRGDTFWVTLPGPPSAPDEQLQLLQGPQIPCQLSSRPDRRGEHYRHDLVAALLETVDLTGFMESRLCGLDQDELAAVMQEVRHQQTAEEPDRERADP